MREENIGMQELKEVLAKITGGRSQGMDEMA